MKGSIKRYCTCTGPDGKQLNTNCPTLDNPKHGLFGYRDRLMTSKGYKAIQRRGFSTRKAADAFRSRVYALLDLAKGDAQSVARIGDLIFKATAHGGRPPEVDDVRRRLGLGAALDRSMLTRDFLEEWYASKKRRKPSTLRGYRQHLDHFLIPQLGDFPLDRLTALHICDLFDLIECRATFAMST